jgi:hypothetical protein
MKEQQTVYKCDICGLKLSINGSAEQLSHIHLRFMELSKVERSLDTGSKWKTVKSISVHPTTLKEQHFCCKDCAMKFFESCLDKMFEETIRQMEDGFARVMKVKENEISE